MILVIDTTKIEEKWWKESFDQKLAKVTRIKKLCCSWLMQSCGQSNTSWLTVLCKQSTWKVCLSGKNLSVNKANALMFWKTHYIRSESKWFCSFQIPETEVDFSGAISGWSRDVVWARQRHVGNSDYVRDYVVIRHAWREL